MAHYLPPAGSTQIRKANGSVVTVLPAVVQVVGPASYAAGGFQVDCSAFFSSIIAAVFSRRFVTATGISSPTSPMAVPSENGTDTYANAKFRALEIRGGTITPAGTVAAPTVNLTNGAVTDKPVGNAGSSTPLTNSGNGAVTGLTGVQAPAFTGTSTGVFNTVETGATTNLSTLTYEWIVWGIPK